MISDLLLQALIDVPSQAYATFVPDTAGLRFCLLEVAQLNDIAPQRLLVDPSSAITNNIADFIVPVSCRIDPSSDSFQVSEHLHHPCGIDLPSFLRYQHIRCWSRFKYPEVGKPGENRGAQYSKLVVLYQPSPPSAEPAAVEESQAHTSADTKVLNTRPSRPPLDSTANEKAESERATSVSRPGLAHRSESTPSTSIKLPGLKTRRPVLLDGSTPSMKGKSPVLPTNLTNFERSTLSETSIKSILPFGPQLGVAKSELQPSESQKWSNSELSEPEKRQSTTEVKINPSDGIQISIKVFPKSRPSQERHMSTDLFSASSSDLPCSSQVAATFAQPVSQAGARSVANDEQRELIDLFDKEAATSNDEKATGANSNLENVDSSSERLSSSSLFQSVASMRADAPSESPLFQSARSEISDTPSEDAPPLQHSESSVRPPENIKSPLMTGEDGCGDEQETPRPTKRLTLASKDSVVPPDDDQKTPQSTRSHPSMGTERPVTIPDDNQWSPRSTETLTATANPITQQVRRCGMPVNYTYSDSHSLHAALPYQANLSQQDIGSQERSLCTSSHDFYAPSRQTYGQSWPQYPGFPVMNTQVDYETHLRGFGAAPMYPVGTVFSTKFVHWPMFLVSPVWQPYQPPYPNVQPIQHPNQPGVPSEGVGSPDTIVSSAAATTPSYDDYLRARSRASRATFQSQSDATDRPIRETVAHPNDDDKIEFHSMMNQRTPNPGGNGRGRDNSKANTKAPKMTWNIFNDPSTAKRVSMPISARSPHLQNISAHSAFVKDVYRLLTPLLTTAQVFPGPLELEVQIGIVSIMNKLGATESNFMAFEEMNEVIHPRGDRNGPSTVFFDRITTLPADIDHILHIRTDGGRLFENRMSTFTINYEFHCVLKTGVPLVISIDENGNATVNKPKVTLGSVHVSYPDRIWDAAAVLHGYLGPHGEPNPEVERAVQYLAENLWVEPNRTHVRLLTRFNKDVLSVKKVLLKRINYHRCKMDRYVNDIESETSMPGLHLRITEVQDLVLTARQSNCDILEAACKSLDDMVKAHRQWWEVALISPAIQTALSEGVPATIGDGHRNWCPIDILGSETGLITNTPASPTAQSIGHYGLGQLLRLATTVIENIDPVGYSNVGPVWIKNKLSWRTKLLEWRLS